VRTTVTRPRLAALALELGLVTAAVLAGSYTGNRLRLIPKAVLHLPDVSFTAADVRVVLLSTLIACAVTFLIARAVAGWDVWRSGRRAAADVYAFVAGSVIASQYQFFLTAVNFSPEFLLQSVLFGTLFLLLAYVLFGPRQQPVPARVVAPVGGLFGLLNRPLAWAVIALSLVPIFVGRKFSDDRQFANWVTQLRVDANVTSDRPYVLVNALGTTKFKTPIMVQFARSDPKTIYVLTRNGELWRADYPSGGSAQKLMDLSSGPEGVGFVEMENGALGFDLHPEFGRAGSKNAGFVYVYYTEYHPDRQVNHLTRYDLSQPTIEARRASALRLIEQRRGPDGFHNAGMVAFGPDGMLYLSIGEASMTECHQRIDCALVGGIFRIDVDNRGGSISRPIQRQPKDGRTGNYMIPLDNPWADRGAAALGEYWAIGLRNPFRFGFDPANGQMMAGDVGSNEWEEVNRIERGHNYQYPYIEGYTPQVGEVKPQGADYVGVETQPILTYHHTAFVRSVIGGTIYRGSRLPEFTGKFLFADNYAGEIYTIPADARPRVTKWDVIAKSPEVAQNGLTAMVVAPDGEILVPLMGSAENPTGIVAKLVRRDSAEGRRERAVETAAADAAKAAAARGGPVVAVSLVQARTLYGTNCARCHGLDGKGDGPDSQKLGDYVPNFHDPNFQRWMTDDAIRAVLKGGGPAIGRGPQMPPWAGILSPAEIEGMKNLVRSWAPKDGEKPKG
jgi:glucose/arabinose dehydrogenase